MLLNEIPFDEFWKYKVCPPDCPICKLLVSPESITLPATSTLKPLGVDVPTPRLPVIARLELIVEEAVEINPFKNASVVDVACSPVDSFVKGQAIVPPEHPLHVVTVRFPMFATFALRLVVDANPET